MDLNNLINENFENPHSGPSLPGSKTLSEFRDSGDSVDRMMARASRVLMASLDYQTTLHNVAHIAVPEFAEFCFFDVFSDAGQVQRVAWAHADPERQKSFEGKIQEFVPLAKFKRHPLNQIRDTRKSVWIPVATDEWKKSIAIGAEHLRFMRDLKFGSLIAVPLIARNHLVGALTLGRCEGAAPYTETDLAKAEELAVLAALAVDNSQLHSELGELKLSLEERVRTRTGELIELNEMLRQSEEKFRVLAEAIPQLVWTARPDGYADYFNQRWTDYTGLTEKQCNGFGWKQIIHPDDVSRLATAWSQALETGVPYETECRVRRALDGVYRWHLSRALPLRDKEGHVFKWFGTTTDIDEQKRVEESLRERTQQLARSNADLEQFAYVASHDLKEPLRMVTTYMGLLGKRYQGKLDQSADEYIHFATEGAKRMYDLIDDLLDYSRAGRSDEPLVSCDANAICNQAIANLRTAIQESTATLKRESLPKVQAVPAQLTLVFQNLIGNALKYRSHESPQIHISAEFKADHWLFCVRDNGIGIEPSCAERIFVIFQRLHGRDEYSGTGIGLAICKKIIERHGGKIWVDSAPGRGAFFYFTLPIAIPKKP